MWSGWVTEGRKFARATTINRSMRYPARLPMYGKKRCRDKACRRLSSTNAVIWDRDGPMGAPRYRANSVMAVSPKRNCSGAAGDSWPGTGSCAVGGKGQPAEREGCSHLGSCTRGRCPKRRGRGSGPARDRPLDFYHTAELPALAFPRVATRVQTAFGLGGPRGESAEVLPI